jgi:quinol-cytochrome oxidoreductase complex cytochrome b subunit
MNSDSARTSPATRPQRTKRSVFAGLALHEVRALLRGDPPTERPNPRYRAHVNSFLLHIRPRTYLAAATRLTHTWFLGVLAVLLFAVELVTGVLLMVFYAPTPEQAYASILAITYYTPYGDLLRDVHRLGAEVMVIVVVLHMARTFLTGSYKGPRAFTWLTGVLLLVVTLLLSFSGYLLPWDQLAYWAVTIGTSMAQATPLIGAELNLLLRGATEIGADGLLRFYLLHVLLLPLAGILLIAVHYYRIARHHGISLPAAVEEGDLAPEERAAATRKIDFLPTLFVREVVVVSFVLLALFAAAHYLFDAPLEQQADPFHTPLNTQAPWFFLWVQGLLKLGDKTLMGVIVPVLFFVLLAALPYLDRNPARCWQRRPAAMVLALAVAIAIGVLSYMGTATYGITLPPAVRIAETLAPEEGEGALRSLPYDALTPGSYALDQPISASVSPKLHGVLERYAHLVTAAAAAGELPNAEAFLDIVERQADLKEATVRIVWQPSETERQLTYTRTIYLHRGRNAASIAQDS